jgi:hypothetical protein
MRIAAAIELIMPPLLYDFIIKAYDQPGWHPLRNKITPLSLACDLAQQRKPNGPHRNTKEGG